ncbi:glutathione S-transferase family protein [Sphingomonas sp. CJ99]
MTLTITGFDWVPDFAKGYVRDLRVRWACEEIGCEYRMDLIDPRNKPADHYARQPWGQVPTLDDGGVEWFESGAILLHLGERSPALLPTDPAARARTISWLFAAYNSVEPWIFQIVDVMLFSSDKPWAEARRPSLVADAGKRLDRLVTALGDRDWLAGDFSIADIAMITMLRDDCGTGVISDRPALVAYVERGTARPAFQRALAAQLADFNPEATAA